MTDRIKHHCGLAMVRLRKPLSYYRKKYRTASWGLDKLQLLMIKQRNRGQDGAGIATVKLEMPVGYPCVQRNRSAENDSVQVLFENTHKAMHDLYQADQGDNPLSDRKLKTKFDFIGEVYLGHLRYGTHGEDGLSSCHPYIRQSNWLSRTLVLAGNFTLTNSKEIFDRLVSYGLNPVGVSDTLTLLEKIGHFLDLANERILAHLTQSNPDLSGPDLAIQIADCIKLEDVLKQASRDWDGGYVLCGLLGHGDAFICRDPLGIRPAFYYIDDEVIAVASERAALTTIFNVQPDAIRSVEPGHALICKRDGTYEELRFAPEMEPRRCTFERIYFSRGNDPAIYHERKNLGKNLAQNTLDAVDWNVNKTVFSFIPNTAETAFLGLVEGISHILQDKTASQIWVQHQNGTLTEDSIKTLIAASQPRVEKATHKDQKVRTFITQDQSRTDLVRHVYDITRDSVQPDESLVVLDDSIVRGTTLRESIVTMLARLNPKKIVVVSSAPPIKYPDCYGIDMSELGKFVAFRAAIDLVRLQPEGDALINSVYEDCKAHQDQPLGAYQNHLKRIYDAVDDIALSMQIAKRVRPDTINWDGELIIVYQTIDGLKKALPGYTGDWYFTGDYPTPGGFRVVNTAFINYYENRTGRSYG